MPRTRYCLKSVSYGHIPDEIIVNRTAERVKAKNAVKLKRRQFGSNKQDENQKKGNGQFLKIYKKLFKVIAEEKQMKYLKYILKSVPLALRTAKVASKQVGGKQNSRSSLM